MFDRHPAPAFATGVELLARYSKVRDQAYDLEGIISEALGRYVNHSVAEAKLLNLTFGVLEFSLNSAGDGIETRGVWTSGQSVDEEYEETITVPMEVLGRG